MIGALLLTVDKHHVAGLAVLVVGALIALFGIFRIVKRLSGSALIVAAGLAIAVIGVLLYTHTIHS